MVSSALGNQHQRKLTVQTEITSKSLAVLAFESSSWTAELKLESLLVGRAGEFVIMVRMVENERLMGEIAGHFRHLVIKCQVCTLYGDVRWDRRAEMGNKVRWKQGGAWMAQTIGGHGSVVGGEMLWSWSKVSNGVR